MHYKLGCISLLTYGLLTSAAIAQTTPNFAGSYVLQGGTADFQSPTEQHHANSPQLDLVALDVSQSAETLTVKRIWKDGHSEVNEIRLDGKEGIYHFSDGNNGRYHAWIKANRLIVETTWARDTPNGQRIKYHSKQEWQLSADQKLLTTTTMLDSPDVPINVTSTTRTVYTRK